MITTCALIVSTFLSGQVGARRALPFNTLSSITLGGLHEMDVVAIVRPTGVPRDSHRGPNVWSSQSFEVVSGTNPLGTREVVVSVPYVGQYRGRTLTAPALSSNSVFAPPAQHLYLLLAVTPKNGRLQPIYTGRGGSDPIPTDGISEDGSISAGKSEVFGVALVRTNLTALPPSASKEGAILRALALSTGEASDTPYSATHVWNRLLPFSTATWDGEDLERKATRDVIESMPAADFFRTVLAPLIPVGSKQDARAVNGWALRTRWGAEGAATKLAESLAALVSSGDEEKSIKRDSALLDLGNAGYRERVGLPESTMLTIAARAKTPFLRDLALSYILKAPTAKEQRALVPLLDDAAVRRKLMTKLANWNHHPELAPPSREAEYLAREAELVAAWKSLLLSDTVVLVP